MNNNYLRLILNDTIIMHTSYCIRVETNIIHCIVINGYNYFRL